MGNRKRTRAKEKGFILFKDFEIILKTKQYSCMICK